MKTYVLMSDGLYLLKFDEEEQSTTWTSKKEKAQHFDYDGACATGIILNTCFPFTVFVEDGVFVNG